MSFLEDACGAARERVEEARRLVPLAALQARAHELPPAPGFATALAFPGTGVIAEVKRASPSRGHMTFIPNPGALGRAYVAGGASAVSVLTEPRWFHGSLADLEAVAHTVTAPVLRKDFVVDDYQLWEARAAGAAAVLLIVAALPDDELARLAAEAHAAGLDTLVEVHDEDEAARGAKAHAAAGTGHRLVMGVNARDLASLQVDSGRFAAVRDALPADAITVAESGVQGPDDVRTLKALGADAVLVGEHVATHHDPEAAVRALVEAGR